MSRIIHNPRNAAAAAIAGLTKHEQQDVLRLGARYEKLEALLPTFRPESTVALEVLGQMEVVSALIMQRLEQ